MNRRSRRITYPIDINKCEDVIKWQDGNLNEFVSVEGAYLKIKCQKGRDGVNGVFSEDLFSLLRDIYMTSNDVNPIVVQHLNTIIGIFDNTPITPRTIQKNEETLIESEILEKQTSYVTTLKTLQEMRESMMCTIPSFATPTQISTMFVNTKELLRLHSNILSELTQNGLAGTFLNLICRKDLGEEHSKFAKGYHDAVECSKQFVKHFDVYKYLSLLSASFQHPCKYKLFLERYIKIVSPDQKERLSIIISQLNSVIEMVDSHVDEEMVFRATLEMADRYNLPVLLENNRRVVQIGEGEHYTAEVGIIPVVILLCNDIIIIHTQREDMSERYPVMLDLLHLELKIASNGTLLVLLNMNPNIYKQYEKRNSLLLHYKTMKIRTPLAEGWQKSILKTQKQLNEDLLNTPVNVKVLETNQIDVSKDFRIIDMDTSLMIVDTQHTYRLMIGIQDIKFSYWKKYPWDLSQAFEPQDKCLFLEECNKLAIVGEKLKIWSLTEGRIDRIVPLPLSGDVQFVIIGDEILCMGEKDGLFDIHILDNAKKDSSWRVQKTKEPPVFRTGFRLVRYSKYLIVVGGRIEGDGVNKIDAYDLMEKKWHEWYPFGPDELPPFDNHTLCVSGTFLYIIVDSYVYVINLETLFWCCLTELIEPTQRVAPDGDTYLVRFGREEETGKLTLSRLIFDTNRIRSVFGDQKTTNLFAAPVSDIIDNVLQSGETSELYETFLMSFRLFCPATTLMRNLYQRHTRLLDTYTQNSKFTIGSQRRSDEETASLSLHTQVCNLIKRWYIRFPSDFDIAEVKEMYEKMKKTKIGTYRVEFLIVPREVREIKSTDSERSKRRSAGYAPYDDQYRYSYEAVNIPNMPPDNCIIDQTDVVQFARQLAFNHFQYLCRIDIRNLITGESDQALNALSLRTRQIRNWVEKILDGDNFDLKKKVDEFVYLVSLAEECKKCRDYHSLRCIITSIDDILTRNKVREFVNKRFTDKPLQKSPSFQKSQTFQRKRKDSLAKALPRKTLKTFREMSEFVWSDKANYHEMEIAELPMIPPPEIIKQKLERLSGHQFVNSGINYTICKSMTLFLKRIADSRCKDYEFEFDQIWDIQAFFFQFE